MGQTARPGSTYAVDLRQGFVGALVAALVGIGGNLFASATWQAVLGALIALLVVTGIGTRRRRRRQQLLAAVLVDPSASGSAGRSLSLVATLLRSGTSLTEVTEVAKTVTALRRHPHTALLGPVLEQIDSAGDERERRRRAIAAAERAERRRQDARADLVDRVAQFVSDSETADTVLVCYGYSSALCDGIAAVGPRLTMPIWVLEDLQYGPESLREHEDVVRVLEGSGLRPQVLPFEAATAVLGTGTDLVTSLDGESVVLPGGRRILALIGCEAFDDDGHVLIPAIVSGRASASAKFAELFTGQHPHRLYVVAESFKRLPFVDAEMRRTTSPLKTPWWLRPLHAFGLAVPFRGKPVELVSLRDEVSGIVTDDISRDWVSGPSARAVTPPRRTTSPGDLADVLRSSRAWLVDVHGTLVDDSACDYEAFAEVVQQRTGRRLPWSVYTRACQDRTDQEALVSLAQQELVAGPLDDLLAQKRAAYTHARNDCAQLASLLRPGATELLDAVKQSGRELRLVTGHDGQWVKRLLTETPLGDVVDEHEITADVGAPQRLRWMRTMVHSLTLPPSTVVLVDDRLNNVELAASLGLRSVLVGDAEVDAGSAVAQARDLRHVHAALSSAEAVHLRAAVEAVGPVDDQAPDVSVRVPGEVTAALVDALLPLLEEAFPEREWTAATAREQVLTPASCERLITCHAPDGRLRGIVTLHAMPSPDEAKLHWLAVTASERRRGVGAALVGAAAAEADRLRCSQLVLTTERYRRDALSLYYRLGFSSDSHAQR